MPRIPSTSSKVKVEICKGSKALTVTKAKELLGWEEESETPFKRDYAFKDLNGVKVRCNNNTINRPIRWSNILMLKQEYLKQRWKLNGETIIIGDKGSILDGQHTLISFVLSSQEIKNDPSLYPEFKKGIKLEKIIVTGVSEIDEVVNTINTGIARSLSDVVFRSEFFKDLNQRDRKIVSKATEYAVKLLWSRTGAGLDAYSLRRTHSESLDFIDRHNKILECVSFIVEENGGSENKVKSILPLGTAAGLLYLMASSNSDDAGYFTGTKSESDLNFDMFDKACEFWVLLSSNSEELKIVRSTLSRIINQHGDNNLIRIALICKAWNKFSIGKVINQASLKLKFDTDEDGNVNLAETPTVGGIDKGNPQDSSERDPSPEEIQEQASKIRSTKSKRKNTNSKPDIGDEVLVKQGPDKEGWWKGEITKFIKNQVCVKVSNGYAGAGTIVKVSKTLISK